MKLNISGRFERILALTLVGATASLMSFGDDASQAAAASAAGSAPALTASVANPEPTSKVIGTADFRLEYNAKPGGYDTDNYFELGYQFNPDLKIKAYMEVMSNFMTPEKDSYTGSHVVLGQTFVRLMTNNIWKSGDTSLNYQIRVYVPTAQSEQESGNITRLYNGLSLNQKFSEAVTVHMIEAIIPQVFSTAGYTNKGGDAVANSAYQNRFGFIADVNLSSKLSLSVPLLWYADRNRDYASSADRNDAWTSFVYIWPELDYAINDNFSLGVAYHTDNLVKTDLSQLDLSNGFKNSTVQLAATFTL